MNTETVREVMNEFQMKIDLDDQTLILTSKTGGVGVRLETQPGRPLV